MRFTLPVLRRPVGRHASRPSLMAGCRNLVRLASGTLAVAMVAGLCAGAVVTTAAPAQAATAMSCNNGIVYTLDTDGTLRQVNTTNRAQTTVGTISTTVGLNGLALSNDGRYAYAVSVSPAGRNGTLTVYRYDSQSGLTSTYTGASGLSTNDGYFVMGGINPLNGYYYFARGQGANLDIFAFNTANATAVGKVASVPVAADAGGTARSNGDLAFGSDGTMYIVASSNTTTSDSNVLMRVDQPVPTTAGNPTLSATILSTLDTNGRAKQFNGIAFGSGPGSGYLYLDTSGRDFYKIDPGPGELADSGTLSQGTPVDMASCQYVNSLKVQKNIVGRAAAGDQFTVGATANGKAIGSTGTTAGSSSGPQAGGGQVALSVPVGGASITLSEQGVNGADLTKYVSSYVCRNDNDGSVVASGTGSSGTFTFPNQTGGGVNITCVLTNSPKVNVTVSKTWTNAIAGDIAAFSANAATGSSTAPNNGTVITAKGGKAGDVVNVAETLGAGNKGSYDTTLVCKDSKGATLAQGSLTGSFTLGTADVNCMFTNSNQGATVTVGKKWIVNGTAYANGNQPAGISAALELDGPGAGGFTGQQWGVARAGYFAGNAPTIRETTTIDPAMNCTLTGSQVTDANGVAVTGALPYQATLKAGVNTFTVTNTVDCTTQLTVLKFIDGVNGGTLKPSQFTLTATPGTGAALQFPGSNDAKAPASTKAVTPGTSYTLAETGAASLAYLQLSLQRYTGAVSPDGSLADPNAWVDVGSNSVTVPLGGHAVYRFVNASVPAFTLPLTGGTGSGVYLWAGGGLLVLAMAVAGVAIIRRNRTSND